MRKDNKEEVQPDTVETIAENEKAVFAEEMSEAEQKQYIKECKIRRKNRKAIKVAKFRPLKNFFIFLSGMFTSILILVLSVVIVGKLIPLKTFTGDVGSDQVSTEITDKSVYDALMGINTYTLEDFPILTSLIDDALEAPLAGNLKLGDVVVFDKDTFNSTLVTNIAEVTSCITVDFDGIKINKLISETGSDQLYGILIDATRPADAVTWTSDDITLEVLMNGLDVNKVKLSSVAEETSIDAKVVSFLESTIGKDYSLITMQDLSDNMNMDDVKLIDIFPDNANTDLLYTILSNTLNITKDEIEISDISSFHTDMIRIVDILEPTTANADLYSILRQATGCSTNEEITAGKLQEDLTVSNIKLSSLFTNYTQGTNNVLDKILQDSSVTVGNVADKINQLYVSDLVGVSCFTTTLTGKQRYSYNETAKQYVKDDAGEYEISYGAGMWLFLLYNESTADENGNAYSFTDNQYQFKDLTTAFNSSSERIKLATIRQMVDSGIIEGTGLSSVLYPLTLQEALLLVP